MVAVDSNPDAVTQARGHGVNAQQVAWPEFTGNSFDFVLFTRSPHHIHPLQDAVERGFEVLNDGGTIIIEDFDYTKVDTRTVRWFAGTVQVLQAAGQ